MTSPRAVQRATVLNDGRVLLTGGCTEPGCDGFDRGAVSEIFTPKTDSFQPGPTMQAPRASNSATVLEDGRVLLAGGYPGEGQPPQATAELFDPSTQTFTKVGRMTVGRADQTATLMPDGRVLVAGGTDGNAPLDSTEYFDPATNSFTRGPRLSSARAGQAAVVSTGTLLLIGGTRDGHAATATTDVLHDGLWIPGPRLLQPRIKHAAAALDGGRILVIGGASSTDGRRELDTTELLDAHDEHFTPGPRLSEPEYKLDGAVATLPGGRIVIAGGASVDVYRTSTNEITVVPGAPVPRYSFVTASPISDDVVLIAGGYDDTITPTDRARLVRIP